MKTAIKLCSMLKENGFESYIVGGWVRDRIIGRPSADIDIATDATPDQIIKVFKSKLISVIPTGIKHGTITVIHKQLNPGVDYEITTYRKDSNCDGRHATVTYAKTLQEDLSRRDFTMNAIAYDPFTEEYVDPFNGTKDIEDGIIRCVGDANRRFQEDHLRMLRAIRFKTILGFEIEGSTLDGIINNHNLINNISGERIKMEIGKTFEKAEAPSTIFKTVYILTHEILPEIKRMVGFVQNKYHKYDVFEHTMKAMDAIPKEYPLIRWAALFHDIGKPESCKDYGTPHASFHGHELISERMARTILNRLKFSNEDKDYVCHLIKNHMFQITPELGDGAVRRLVAKIGVEYLDDICRLKFADRVGRTGDITLEYDLEQAAIKRRFKKIQEKDAVFKIKDLCISGADIMEVFNIKPGPEVGKFLKRAFDIVMDTPELNKDKEKLLEVIKPN